MVNINQIQSGASACIVAIGNLQEMAASLQGNVVAYKSQLKVDAAKEVIKANAIYFEIVPPTENLTLNFDIPVETIQAAEYLDRLENAFTAAQKVLVINCTGN